jgi:hypothetical protein
MGYDIRCMGILELALFVIQRSNAFFDTSLLCQGVKIDQKYWHSAFE